MYKPLFNLNSDLLNLIAEASELKSWIEQSLVSVQFLPYLQTEATNKIAHYSTAIEGNQLTLEDVNRIANVGSKKFESNAEQEVFNSLSAMRWIWKRKPYSLITEKDLLKLHKTISTKLLRADAVGDYKKKPNRIVDNRGITIYQPPAPEKVKALTIEMLTWVNSTLDSALHPIIVSGIAHHQLVSIHPFTDGNGRISRALASWILFTRGFDNLHLFALDQYFYADRQRYYLKIQQARDLDYDLTHWLEYVGEGIVFTLKNIKERIASLKLSAPLTVRLTKRQEEFLRFIKSKESVGTLELQNKFKLSRARINQIIKPLVEAKILSKEGKTRATFYRAN